MHGLAKSPGSSPWGLPCWGPNSCSPPRVMLTFTRGGGKGGGTLRKHHGSQELLVGKVFLIIAESRVAGKGTGTASPPEPPSPLPSLQGDAQLDGWNTGSQEGASSIKNQLFHLLNEEVKKPTTNSLHVSFLQPARPGAAGVNTASTFLPEMG